MTHKEISYTKSVIRIIGFLLLTNLYLAIPVLIGSELFGILEEKNEN